MQKKSQAAPSSAADLAALRRVLLKNFDKCKDGMLVTTEICRLENAIAERPITRPADIAAACEILLENEAPFTDGASEGIVRALLAGARDNAKRRT